MSPMVRFSSDSAKVFTENTGGPLNPLGSVTCTLSTAPNRRGRPPGSFASGGASEISTTPLKVKRRFSGANNWFKGRAGLMNAMLPAVMRNGSSD